MHLYNNKSLLTKQSLKNFHFYLCQYNDPHIHLDDDDDDDDWI